VQAVQIAAMDRIYDSAVATIVDCADSAGPGLPGMRSRPRKRSLRPSSWNLESNQAPKPHVVAHPLQLTEVAEASKWNTRGWTYQEDQLSHRQILVGDREVFLICTYEL